MEVGADSGGLGVGLIMVKLLRLWSHSFPVAKQVKVAAVRRLANRSQAPR